MNPPNRKDLIRAYRETPRPMGVYRISNRDGTLTVVDSSVDLASSLNRHRAQLEMGSHPSKALQEEWNDLGPDAFEFEILDTLKPKSDPGYDPSNDLQELESMWRERLSSD